MTYYCGPCLIQSDASDDVCPQCGDTMSDTPQPPRVVVSSSSRWTWVWLAAGGVLLATAAVLDAVGLARWASIPGALFVALAVYGAVRHEP